MESQLAESNEVRQKTSLGRLAPWLLAGVITAAYAGTFGNAFIFDDWEVINWVAKAKLNLHFLCATRLLANLTFKLNYLVAGLNTADYHAVNIIIHVIAAVTLYGIVRLALCLPPFTDRYKAVAGPLALATAAIWGAHPLLTQSVTYIAQRYESMASMFMFVCLYCFIRGITAQRPWRWLVVSLLASAAGMMTKEIAIVLPIIILLFDYVLVSRSLVGALRQRLFYYAGLFGTWILTRVLAYFQAVENPGGFFVWQGVSPATYLLTEAGVVVHYLRLSFWPVGLCFDYAWPPARLFLDVWPNVAFLTVLVAAIMIGIVRKRELALPCAIFFVMLAATSSVVPRPDFAFEHRMYAPLACVVVVTVIAGYEALRKYAGPWIMCLLACALTAGLAVMTYQRNMDYRSDLTMWRDIVTKSPGNARAYINLSAHYLSKGEMDTTISYCNEALKHLPDFRRLEINELRRMKYNPDVDQLFREVSYYSRAHNNIGLALRGQGKLDDAILHFKEATRLIPENASSLVNLASVMFDKGQTAESIAILKRAIVFDPLDHAAYECLGNALVLTGNAAASVKYYAKALALVPDDIAVQCKLAWLLATDPDASVRDGRRAVLLAEEVARATKCGSAHVLDVLAAGYAENGRFEDAAATARKAAELASPDEGIAIKARLELYLSHKPYHESVGPANGAETNP
jgi:tetratricopeptide (TPR) repeat protein